MLDFSETFSRHQKKELPWVPIDKIISKEHITTMTGEKYRISLLKLPVEILYRICDFLDAETIVYSFGHVCQQFHSIAKTYNRYKISFRSMSKINLCRIISPENIITFDFGDTKRTIDWIERFLSISQIDQFTRLRSLSLHDVKINNLNIVLHHLIQNCRLISFVIHCNISKDDHEILQLLSSIIEQVTLRNLTLYFNLSDKETFSWPQHCNVEKLCISTCTIKQFCSILHHSARLHYLIMNDCHINEMIPSNVYQQLISLTLNDIRMTMDKLEYVLSLLPSLVHLDLSSSGKPFEFIRRLSQWENFLRLKLPRLSQLEFCIFCFCSNWENFESLIISFRTPFWIEEKHWFVTCQFRDDWTSSFTVFTSSNSSITSHLHENNFDQIICRN